MTNRPRFIVMATYLLEEERLGTLRKQDHDLVAWEACSPGCPGWGVFDVNRDHFIEIQRCDECGRFDTDDEAVEHVVKKLENKYPHEIAWPVSYYQQMNSGSTLINPARRGRFRTTSHSVPNPDTPNHPMTTVGEQDRLPKEIFETMATAKRKITKKPKMAKKSDRRDYPKHSLLVSIRDNVLDDSDFPIARVFFHEEEPIIVRTKEIKPGAYNILSDFCPTPGWTLHELVDWIQRDPTGEHPEIWHCWAFASDSFILREGWKSGRVILDVLNFMIRKIWKDKYRVWEDKYLVWEDVEEAEDDKPGFLDEQRCRSWMWTLMKRSGLDILDRIDKVGTFKSEQLDSLFAEVCRDQILHEAAMGLVEAAKVMERYGIPKYGSDLRDHASMLSRGETEVNRSLLDLGLRRLLGLPVQSVNDALSEKSEEDVII